MAARFLSSLVNCLHVSIPEDVEFLPLFPLLASSQFNHFKYRFNRFINRKETRHKCGLRCIYYCVNNIYIIPERVECIQTFWTDGSCILFNNLKKKIINLKLNKTSTLITRITTKKLGYEYIPFAAFSLNPAISPTLSKFKRAKYANWKTLRRFLTLLKVKNVNETGKKKKKKKIVTKGHSRELHQRQNNESDTGTGAEEGASFRGRKFRGIKRRQTRLPVCKWGARRHENSDCGGKHAPSRGH